MNDQLTIKNLIYRYQHEPVLDIPDWQVKQGQHLFLHGPSGSGKSTLLNILSGILNVTTGTVNLFGTQLNNLSDQQRDVFRAQHIGYVFQHFNLVPYLTVIDNIKLAIYFADGQQQDITTKITTMLSQLDIAQSLWHKPSRQLSVGQQQRVAIVRALINQPRLLILDEPTSSLDQQNTERFMNLLQQQLTETNTTVIFVSHDMRLADYFKDSQALLTFNQVLN